MTELNNQKAPDDYITSITDILQWYSHIINKREKFWKDMWQTD